MKLFLENVFLADYNCYGYFFYIWRNIHKVIIDNSLSRELSRKQNENQMFVYSFEASASMLSSDTEYIQKNDIEKIIDSVKRSMGESRLELQL